jgi:hypothetical protein
MDDLSSGDIPFDPVQKPQEFLMAVALHILSYDRSVQHVERRK